MKYSGESKFVDVRGDVEGDYAVLRVRDHGVGIPKEELPKIFQRFSAPARLPEFRELALA